MTVTADALNVRDRPGLAGDVIGVEVYGALGQSFPVSTRVKVMTDALNVRDAAGLGSSVVGVVTYGAIGETFASVMSADGYAWTEVRFPNVTGWVATFLLAETGGGNAGGNVAVGDMVQVVDGPLNIRSGPATSNGVIDVAATGAVARVIDGPSSADGFTWIKIDGNLLEIGWVRLRVLPSGRLAASMGRDVRAFRPTPVIPRVVRRAACQSDRRL